ncbi:SpnB-like Rossmann fold domain-containing protein [Streptomyces sp. G45]|uniref:SpnB-like Rossmann fold domain-containing protein n=1 Tax=Streptomyces sp. G45 TaxID=3406627 RepID=UPI003C19F2E7
MVDLPDGGGAVFTGRLSGDAGPWAEGDALGAVVVPGEALLELALFAAELTGRGGVEEFDVHAPLVVADAEDAVTLRVLVDADGAVSAYARRDGQDGDEGDWVKHATGTLAAEGAFDGVTWARDDETYALFLDAAARAAGPRPDGEQRLTHHWRGASVRLDDEGRPVLAAEAVDTRAVTLEETRARSGGRDALYHVEWVEPSGPAHAEAVPHVVHVCPPLDEAAPDGFRALTARLLPVLQQWVTDERQASAKLVVVTRGAVDGRDLGHAAVWGLVRAAESEHPGRFVLVDLDADADVADAALPEEALRLGEPELAVRDGVIRVPRLARATAADSGGTPTWAPTAPSSSPAA